MYQSTPFHPLPHVCLHRPHRSPYRHYLIDVVAFTYFFFLFFIIDIVSLLRSPTYLETTASCFCFTILAVQSLKSILSCYLPFSFIILIHTFSFLLDHSFFSFTPFPFSVSIPLKLSLTYFLAFVHSLFLSFHSFHISLTLSLHF